MNDRGAPPGWVYIRHASEVLKLASALRRSTLSKRALDLRPVFLLTESWSLLAKRRRQAEPWLIPCRTQARPFYDAALRARPQESHWQQPIAPCSSIL